MFNLEASYKFLLSMFDESMHLLRASPIAERDTYWIFNDNYLASVVLKGVSWVQGDLIANIASFQQARVAVLHGRTFPVELQNDIVDVRTVGDKKVKTEVPNQGEAPLSVSDYTDIAFYSVLNKFNMGLVNEALEDLKIAEDLFWDGVWFKDKSFTGVYQIYKGALYLIACNRLSYIGEHRKECEDLIDLAQAQSMQESSNPVQYGGVFCDYIPPDITGDVNVETTCLAILARRFNQ